jgi:transposase
MGSRKSFDKDFKLTVVRDLESGKSTAQVSREQSIKPGLVLRWRREYRANPKHAFSGKGVTSTVEARNAELERLVGKLYAENDFLKKALDSLRSMLAEAKEER